jgi:hypothetical protein
MQQTGSRCAHARVHSAAAATTRALLKLDLTLGLCVCVRVCAMSALRRCLQLLQKLVLSADLVGQALVPYYRQILPIFNLYITRYVVHSVIRSFFGV